MDDHSAHKILSRLIIEEPYRENIERNLDSFLQTISVNTYINLLRSLNRYSEFCVKNSHIMFPLVDSVLLKFIDYRSDMDVLGRTIDNEIHLLKSLDSLALKKKTSIGHSAIVAISLRKRKKVDRSLIRVPAIHYEEIERWVIENKHRINEPGFIRANAMFKVAYNGMLKISELSFLKVCDINFSENCIELKNEGENQHDESDPIYLWQDTIDALKRWLDISHLSCSSSLFWSIFLGKKLKLRAPISDSGINLIIKRELGRDCSGHSFRIGACEDMATKGIRQQDIMDAGRWREAKMPTIYTKKEKNRENNGMAKLENLMKKNK